MHIDFEFMPAYATLLKYPTPQMPSQAAALADRLQTNSEIWQDLLEAFALHVSLTPLRELEETYTQLFDMNPSCTLEIGWHLFGETYKRGSFLANMRRSLQEHRIEEGGALPDFLPSLLELLPHLEKEDAQGLVSDCILPALAKIRPQTGGAVPYDLLLESLDLMLKELAPQSAALSAGSGSGCGCGGSHGDANGQEVKHAR